MANTESPKRSEEHPTLPTHGARQLPSVLVDSYSLELEDEEGYAGDKANKGAFSKILDECAQHCATPEKIRSATNRARRSAARSSAPS